MRLSHSGVIRSRMRADLRRLARPAGTGIGNRSVDLRRGRASRRRPSDTALARSRASCARRRLRRKSTRSGPLILWLERRRLRRRRRGRRGPLEAWRRLWHLMRRGLLLLGRRRRRRDGPALPALARHNGAEGVGAHANSWRRGLGRTLVGRRPDHRSLRGTSTALLDLATEVTDLLFEPIKRCGLVDARKDAIGSGFETYFCFKAIWVCSMA